MKIKFGMMNNVMMNNITDVNVDEVNKGGSYTVAGSFVSLLASCGSICNLVVLGTLWVRRKKLTPVELCICNMSIAGLIPSLASYPMYAASCFADKWIYSYMACLIDGFVVFYTGMLGIATLVVIAVIRLISTEKTCSGYRGKSLSNKHALLALLCAYMYSSVWTIPPFFGWGKYGLEPNQLNCAIRWNELKRSYFITLFVFGYVCPLLIIMFCYIRMARLMRDKMMEANRGSFNARNVTSRRIKTDTLLMKFGIATCSSFFIMWTPYAIFGFLAYFDLHILITKAAALSPSLFAKSSVLVNPIIYFFMVKRFRKDASLWLSSFQLNSEVSTSAVLEMREVSIDPEGERKKMVFGVHKTESKSSFARLKTSSCNNSTGSILNTPDLDKKLADNREFVGGYKVKSLREAFIRMDSTNTNVVNFSMSDGDSDVFIEENNLVTRL